MVDTLKKENKFVSKNLADYLNSNNEKPTLKKNNLEEISM